MGGGASKEGQVPTSEKSEPAIRLSPALEKKWVRRGLENELVEQVEVPIPTPVFSPSDLDAAYQQGREDMQKKLEAEWAAKREAEREAEKQASRVQEEDISNKVTSKLSELKKQYYIPSRKPVECTELRTAVVKCYEGAGMNTLVCKDVVEAFSACSKETLKVRWPMC